MAVRFFGVAKRAMSRRQRRMQAERPRIHRQRLFEQRRSLRVIAARQRRLAARGEDGDLARRRLLCAGEQWLRLRKATRVRIGAAEPDQRRDIGGTQLQGARE
jgi:hypothetical protein